MGIGSDAAAEEKKRRHTSRRFVRPGGGRSADVRARDDAEGLTVGSRPVMMREKRGRDERREATGGE